MNIFSRYKQNITKAIFAFVMFFSCLGYVNADLVPTIHSTIIGGNWNSASTWLEGRVPTVDDIVEVNGLVNIVGNTTVGGIKINSSGTLRKQSLNTGYITLAVSGSLENNGIVGGSTANYVTYINYNVLGDVLNNGTISYINSLSIYGSLENINGNIPVNTYLRWLPITGYTNYLVNITGQNESQVTTNSYLLPTTIKEDGINLYWKVKGTNSSGNSAYSQPKCLNVPGCVKIDFSGNHNSNLQVIDLGVPYAFNNNDITSKNLSAGEYIYTNSLKTEENFIGPKQVITEETSEGDPVILSTGEFDYENTLMAYPGNNLPFEFKVRYKNSAYYVGPIGNNFDFNYNIYLSQDADGNVNLHDGKLGVFKFTKTTNGFEKNQTIRATLTNIGETYKIKFDNNLTYNFGANNKIQSIQDNYGNKISFEYDTEAQITRIIDTLGNIYSVDYNSFHRISSITDFNAHKVEFVYYLSDGADGSQYDLKTIKMLNGNSDKQIGFTYTVGSDYDSSHNIVKLIDSETNTYVENTYDTNDRVTTQKYGNGTIYYNYTTDTNNSITKNSVTDREGHIIDYYYDTNGNTIKKVVKKSSGNLEYNYIYDSNNNLLKETKPLGNGVEYSYDSNRNIIETRYKSDMSASGSIDDIIGTATYDLSINKPTQIVSANGLTTNFTYDTNGNVLSKQVLGVKGYQNNDIVINETYVYNGSGQLVKQTDASGLETNYTYINGNLTKISKGTGADKIENTFEYDVKGNMVKSIDGKGNITTMSYNDFNLLTQKITQEGITSQTTYNKLNKKLQDKIILGSNEEVNAIYEYDILDNLTKTTQEIDETKSLVTNNIYDTNSRIIESNILNGAKVNYIYDENGLVLQKKVTFGAGANDNLITNYQYDSNERLIKEIIPNVSEINYQYDLYDRIIKKTRADNSYEIYKYDKSNNITTKKVYSDTNTLLSNESYTYDKLNQLLTTTKQIIENQSITGQIQTFSLYNNVGKVTKTIDGKGNETNYNYDIFSRLIETTDNLGNKVKLSYDKNNNVTQKQIISTDNKTTTTTYTYDGDNRLTSETSNLNQTKSYTYNKLNQVVTKTDEKGNTTNYEYNYSGKVTKETKVTTTGNIITNYTYDNQGNLTKVIDSNGNETNYVYDKLNRLTKQIYPDNKEINYTYDNRGNLISRTDANGTTVTNTYDNQNRLTNKSINPGTGVQGVTNETYTYDNLGRILTATDSNNHNLSFAYDSLNRLLTENQNTAIVNYTYDNNNNLTSINNTNYSYDTLNRLTTIKQNNETIINNNYTGLENTSTNYGNNKTITKTYDELRRIKDLNNGIKTYNYTYDEVNNITSDNHKTYSYDDIYRITQTNDTNTTLQLENFAYDNVGNRLTSYNQSTASGANYDYTTNNLNQYTNLSGAILSYQLQEIVTQTTGSGSTGSGTETGSSTITGSGTTETGSGTTGTGSGTTETGSGTTTGTGETNAGTTTITTYTGSYITTNENIDYIYDNNGNLKQDNKYKYYYDYKNRLVKATNLSDETIVEFAYDVLGRRYKKETAEKITNYTFANENILQETTTDTVTNITKTRDYINGLGVDELIAYEQNANRYYYHTNHLGSIVGITDNSANMIVEYDYDTFGKAKVISGDANFENTRLYTGREYDKELGLYYNRARYYNPELARFISRDPIDIKDDVNLYAYVGNNGVNFVDRSGMAKAITADEFKIAFVNAYEDYLSTKRKLENNINTYYAGQRIAGSSSTADASNKFLKLRAELKEKEEIAKKMHYERNIYNEIPDGFTIQDAQNNGWKDVNLNQSAYHQYGVPKGKENDKWISSDGHKEVVFSYLDDSIVTEVENMGTYNFYGLGTTEIINHYKYDVKPYYEWGSGPNDKQILNN